MNQHTDLTDPFEALVRAGQLPEDERTDSAVLAARAAVRRAATTETLRTDVLRRRRRRRLGVRAAVASVGLVAAALVVGGVMVDPDDGRPAGTSAAAAVLERAAEAALAEADPVVGPGQYLKYTRVEQHWVADEDDDGAVRTGSDGEPMVVQSRSTSTFWLPYDLDGDDWTVRREHETVRLGSADPALAAREAGMAVTNGTWTQESWSADGSSRYLRTYDPAWYASLSRDPETLMQQILEGDTEDGASEGSGSPYRFQEIHSEILRSALAPADVRAALFRGLAELPGMVVTEGVATLDGRTGTALGTAGSTWQMVFDSRTGAYIGERSTDPDFPMVDGLDADRTTFLTTARLEVVDRAPKGRPSD